MAGPSMTPGSMATGGTSSTEPEMTAPGSVPEAAHEPDHPDEPAMAAERYQGRHLVHGEGDNGGLPWTNAGGR